MTEQWVWLKQDGEVLARGCRELMEAEQAGYIQLCADRGAVPTPTYVWRVTRMEPLGQSITGR